MDAFSKPLPSFNIKGRTSSNTLLGGVLTIVIFGVVLAYASTKFIEL